MLQIHRYLQKACACQKFGTECRAGALCQPTSSAHRASALPPWRREQPIGFGVRTRGAALPELSHSRWRRESGAEVWAGRRACTSPILQSYLKIEQNLGFYLCFIRCRFWRRNDLTPHCTEIRKVWSDQRTLHTYSCHCNNRISENLTCTFDFGRNFHGKKWSLCDTTT